MIIEKKLLHTSEDFTINQLIKHIRIEEGTCFRDKKFALQSGSKVNNIESSTKNSRKPGNKSGFKKKHAELSNENTANNKKNKSCFFCGKKGHFKKECRFYKKLKMEENAVNKKKANVVEKPLSPTEIIAMAAGLDISIITECNMTMMNKTTDWWYDSGATVHICNDKNLFKSYEAVSNEEILMQLK